MLLENILFICTRVELEALIELVLKNEAEAKTAFRKDSKLRY